MASGYPGYPGQQQRFPPPPGGGSGNVPPGGQQFPPPPGGGFRPGPPSMQPPPGGAPPPAGGGGSAGFGAQPPPPPGAGPAMGNLQQSMGGMSLGAGPPPPPGGPGRAPPPRAPGGPYGGGPPANGAPKMFQPPSAPAPAPAMMQPPGAGMQQPPPPGGSQPMQASSQVAPSPFYQQAPSQPQMQRMAAGPGAPALPGGQPGMMQPPGQDGMMAQQQQQPMFQENVDFSIKIPKRIFRLTAEQIPATASMAMSSKIPFGATLRPLAPPAPDEEDVDVVQPGAAGIVRCKRCRTYINAFVTWLENGRRWRCNICAQLNECPSAYFCHLDQDGQRRDRDQRPELSKGIVEFIAPSEYMVRPPQPPSYFFVIDVSAAAVRSGMLKSAATAIKLSLDDLPGRPRTQIGFITYDNSVHYYSLKAGLSNPQMMVVADLKELFVPAPDDLLVNLQESRDVVESFLDNLPQMFSKSQVPHACLGPALKAAFTVTKHIGGKMCVFQSVLPALGDGALKPRENVRLMGTPDEVKLIKPDMTWYKDTAIEFSRAQISVDMFLFPYSYIDCAALGDLAKYTAGSLHTYVAFNPEADGPRFESQLSKCLTQTTAFEAVMRIRCTKGMRISNFYGNFFIRGTDLLALPNCTSDSVFSFDLVHDEQSVTSSCVTVQSALLYTSSEGERRIRVMTQALPVSSLKSEVVASVDTEALCNLLAKQALEMSLKTNLDNARARLQQTCVEIVRFAKSGDKRTVSGYAAPPMPGQQGGDEEKKSIPENLKLLPLYTLALLKNVAFRGGTDVHPDERVQAIARLNTMWVTNSRHFIYPRMFSIHDMDANAGLPSADLPKDESEKRTATAGRNNILLPRVVNLSVERLCSDGIFLLDNGVDMYIWVGRSSDPAVTNALFGVSSLEHVEMSQVKLRTSGNDHASRLDTIVHCLREDNSPHTVTPKVTVVREGDAGLEARFFWHLIEDRASFNGGTFSYSEFMEFVNRPPGAAGGPAPSGMGGAPPLPPGGMGRGPPPPPGGMGGMGGAPPPPRGGGPPQGFPPPGPPGGQQPPAPSGMSPGPSPAPGSYGGPPSAPAPGPPAYSGPPSAPPPGSSGSGGMPPPPRMGQQPPPPGPPRGQAMASGPPGPPPAPGSFGGTPSAPPPGPPAYGGPPSAPAPTSSYGPPPGAGMPPPPPMGQQQQQQPPPPPPQYQY